jgi:hypothetical protein
MLLYRGNNIGGGVGTDQRNIVSMLTTSLRFTRWFDRWIESAGTKRDAATDLIAGLIPSNETG